MGIHKSVLDAAKRELGGLGDMMPNVSIVVTKFQEVDEENGKLKKENAALKKEINQLMEECFVSPHQKPPLWIDRLKYRLNSKKAASQSKL